MPVFIEFSRCIDAYSSAKFEFIKIFTGDREPGKRLEAAAFGGFYIINTGFFLMFHLTWVNLICNLAGISLLVWLYTESFKKNLFVTCSICLITIGCDTAGTLTFVDYEEGKGVSQIYAVIAVFLIAVCELMAEAIAARKKQDDHIENLPLIFMPVLSIAVFLLLVYTKSCSREGLVIISIGSLLENMLVFYLHRLLIKTFQQKHETDLLRQTIQNYANQLDVVLQSEEKVRMLRHDMKHHLNELSLLARRDNGGEIQKYIRKMQDFMENPNEIVSTGNMEIDSLLNFMLKRAEEELISVNVKVQIPESIQHSFDINIILGNLLENAVEAAMKTEEKLLDICIQVKQGVLSIAIENSFCGELNYGSKGLLTSKERSEYHGIGLRSVKKIVDEYNGMMQTDVHDSRFRVKLVLYIPDEIQ